MKSCEIATYLWDYIWLVSFTAEETALLLQVKGYAWKNGAEVHQNIFVFLLWSKKLLCWKCYSYLILRFLVSFTYPKRFDHTHAHTHILTISKQNMPLWEILKNKNRKDDLEEVLNMCNCLCEYVCVCVSVYVCGRIFWDMWMRLRT